MPLDDATRRARRRLEAPSRMTFEDLPDNWPTLPLTEPQLLADVLDLVVGHHDRVDESFVVLACDSDVRLVQPCVIGPDPGPCDPGTVRAFLDALRDGLVDVERGHAHRGDGEGPRAHTDPRRPRVDSRARALPIAGTGWTLSSAHVVTLDGSRPIAA